MTSSDEEHIIRTNGRRMVQGLAIIVVVMAVGAAIAIPNWHNFAKNPPPVSTITTQASTSGAAAGGASSAANRRCGSNFSACSAARYHYRNGFGGFFSSRKSELFASRPLNYLLMTKWFGKIKTILFIQQRLALVLLIQIQAKYLIQS